MQHAFDHIYSQLQTGLQSCRIKEPAEAEEIDCCFCISRECWREVKIQWLTITHRTESDEIIFFREIKPRYTTEMEYYLNLYQGLLFMPVAVTEQYAYWKDESRRYKRFYDRHEGFIRYFESSQRFLDRDYFRQEVNKGEVPLSERVYDDADCRSSHDHLVRSLGAHKRYYDYALKKAALLK